ncbi:hypothetical protein [Roseimicrobium sp. ORNL1]|uniref:hypothetical protein n=1 Tax=Roseimicrobium sp. ORNL1 TaxID=2711231 RepID=UPI0013E16CAE|nr:hypothetical protein [Roseimicrobium sp. ORNL1]QIF01848.1 hypothetical protein G5S37_10020 [Roseimicrobium sp. ORNL1]
MSVASTAFAITASLVVSALGLRYYLKDEGIPSLAVTVLSTAIAICSYLLYLAFKPSK